MTLLTAHSIYRSGFDQGMADFRYDVFTNCPYQQDSPEANEWWVGWRKGYRAMTGGY